MENQQNKLQNNQQKVYLEQFNTYKDSLKNQHFEVELWKMRIEIISNMKNKEMQLLSEQIIEMVCSTHKNINKGNKIIYIRYLINHPRM